MTVAALCPGEGFEYPGMGRALRDTTAWASVEMATQVTGVDTSAYLSGEDGSERASAREMSIALVVLGVMAYEQARDAGLEASWCAGYGIGRYAALVASGVLDLESALELVVTHLDIWERSLRAAPFEAAVFRGQTALGSDLSIVRAEMMLSDVFDLESVLEPVLPYLDCWDRWLRGAPIDALQFRAATGSDFFVPLADMAFAMSASNSPYEFVLTRAPDEMGELIRRARRDGMTVRRLGVWTGLCHSVRGHVSLQAALVEMYGRIEFRVTDAPILVGGNPPVHLDDPFKASIAPQAFLYEIEGFVNWPSLVAGLRLAGAERFLLLAGDPHLLDLTRETLRRYENDFPDFTLLGDDPRTLAALGPVVSELPLFDHLAFEQARLES